MFWRVVSVGSKLLSLCSQNDTCVAIRLNLLSTTLQSCSFLDLVTAILWDLAYSVLAAMISGAVGAVFSVLVTRRSSCLSLVLLGLGGDDLGDSGAVCKRSTSTTAPQTCPWSAR